MKEVVRKIAPTYLFIPTRLHLTIYIIIKTTFMQLTYGGTLCAASTPYVQERIQYVSLVVCCGGFGRSWRLSNRSDIPLLLTAGPRAETAQFIGPEDSIFPLLY
jgi:hypothetical protein